MKILVLIKQVPDSESQLRLCEAKTAVDCSNVRWVINPFDEYAAEQALILKDKVGAEVVALSVGPARAEDAFRQVLSVGADRAVRINIEENLQDSMVTAKIISRFVAKENFDIIFAGRVAIDDEMGVVPGLVANELGFPFVCAISAFEYLGDQNLARVGVSAEPGIKETYEICLPAVFSCEKSLNLPRYPTLSGKLGAKSKRIDVIDMTNLVDSITGGFAITSFEEVVEHNGCRIIDKPPAQAAAELVRLLKEEAKII